MFFPDARPPVDFVSPVYSETKRVISTPTTRWNIGTDRLKVIMAAAFLVWLALSVVLVYHPGGHVHLDEFYHFLYARGAAGDLSRFVDVWQRPGASAIFVGPAQLGFRAARFAALAVSVLTVLVIYQLGRLVSRRFACLVVLFALLQPYFVLESFAVMTEVPFALCLGLGLIFRLKKRPLAAALVLSLLPLFRPEGFVLLPVLAVFFLFSRDAPGLRRRALYLLSLGLGTAVWVALGWSEFGDPFFLYTNNLYGDAPPGLYGSGGLHWQFLAFLECAGPVIFGLTFIGTVRLLRMRRLLLPVLFLSFLIFHVTLYYFGLWGAMWMPRYFVALLPVTAVLAAAGLEGVARWAGRAGGSLSEGALLKRAGRTILILVCVAGGYFAVRLGVHVFVDYRGDMYAALGDSVEWLTEYAETNEVPAIYAKHPYYSAYYEYESNGSEIRSYEEIFEGRPEAGSLVLWDATCAGGKDRSMGSSPVADPAKYDKIICFDAPPPSFVPGLEHFRVEVYRRIGQARP